MVEKVMMQNQKVPKKRLDAEYLLKSLIVSNTNYFENIKNKCRGAVFTGGGCLGGVLGPCDPPSGTYWSTVILLKSF